MKTKKYISSLVLGGALCLLNGCTDYLESDYLFKERMTIEEVFSNRDYTNEWISNAYSHLGSGYLQNVCGHKYQPFNFSDDMCYNSGDYSNWRNGNYGESGWNNNSAEVWKQCYQGIRQAQIFINNIDRNTLFTAQERADLKAQAHFLVGYYYWYLLRMFGPIPLVKAPADYMDSYEDLTQGRNTYEECADYISELMLLAAKGLPLRRGYEDIVRPTRGAALAIRAKALLYAASPLMNGYAPMAYAKQMIDHEGRELLSSQYDESKWARAAAAAKDVMNLHQYSLYVFKARTQTSDPIAYPITVKPPFDDQFSYDNWPDGWADIDPFESYRCLFDGTVPLTENPENIFTYGQNQSNDNIVEMVLRQLPYHEPNGYSENGMTLKQMDAYYMADGTDAPGKDLEIGRNADGTQRVSGYMNEEVRANYKYSNIGDGTSLQFADREPRFYASVGFNGAYWHLLGYTADKNENPNVQIFYYPGTPNGYKSGRQWLNTGIGIKKFVHPKDIGDGREYEKQSRRILAKGSSVIRYADILLMYAEALNELTSSYDVASWDGGTTYTISRDINEMKKGVQPVRIRAGLHDYTATEYADASLFRAKLKRERQIEFFAENQRYFDLRRWMDAPEEESLPVYGFNVLLGENKRDDFHRPIVIQDFVCSFSDKMWFWPINYTELKRNSKLTQNPGWTYPE